MNAPLHTHAPSTPSIDGTSDTWRADVPRFDAPYLAAATPLVLEGLRRKPLSSDARRLHGMVTALLGRGHQRGAPGSHQHPDWSLVPADTPSGWGVVWWDPRDGEALARTKHRARLGRHECRAGFGVALKIKPPPRYVAGAHPLVLRAITPVCSHTWAKNDAGERVARVWRTECTAAHLVGSLGSLAAKARIEVDPKDLHVELVRADVEPRAVVLGGKIGTRHGWRGTVHLVANAPARWLLEVAARGLGLGSSTAYGCGRVVVETGS